MVDLTEGRLSSVCAKTGAPADGVARIEFTTVPGWTWILLLFSIFPFLIARWFSKVHVQGLVPMSALALGRGQMFNWVVRGLLAAGVGFLLVAFVAGPPVAWAGLWLLIAALLALAIGWPLVWVTGRIEGDWVWLSFTHPQFAREMGRVYGAQAPQP